MNAFVTDVTETSFAIEVEQADLPVFVDFWAPWCGPCRAIAPLFNELADMYRGRIKFAKVNADENMTLMRRFGIRGIPALLLMKNGEVLERSNGASKTRLVALLDPHATDASPAAPTEMEKKLSAFHADAALKERLIARLRGHIEAEQVVASGMPAMDEANQMYSLFAAVLHDTDMARYESEFGIPATIGILEQIIDSTFLRQQIGDDGQTHASFMASFRHYPVRWLQAIPPGADLRDVTPRFLHWLLLDLATGGHLPITAAAAGARFIAGQIAGLHARSLAGDRPSDREWKAAREAAMQAGQESGDDGASNAVLRLAESVAWPASEAGNAAGQAVESLLHALGDIAIGRAYSPERLATRTAIIEAFQRKLKEPGMDRDSLRESAESKAYAAWWEANAGFETDVAGEVKTAFAERMHAALIDCISASAAI